MYTNIYIYLYKYIIYIYTYIIYFFFLQTNESANQFFLSGEIDLSLYITYTYIHIYIYIYIYYTCMFAFYIFPLCRQKSMRTNIFCLAKSTYPSMRTTACLRIHLPVSAGRSASKTTCPILGSLLRNRRLDSCLWRCVLFIGFWQKCRALLRTHRALLPYI